MDYCDLKCLWWSAEGRYKLITWSHFSDDRMMYSQIDISNISFSNLIWVIEMVRWRVY